MVSGRRANQGAQSGGLRQLLRAGPWVRTAWRVQAGDRAHLVDGLVQRPDRILSARLLRHIVALHSCCSAALLVRHGPQDLAAPSILGARSARAPAPASDLSRRAWDPYRPRLRDLCADPPQSQQPLGRMQQTMMRQRAFRAHQQPSTRHCRAVVVRAAAATAEPIAYKASKKPSFPFTRIAGQDDMKLALLLNVIDPNIGGVLVMGDRGCGKSVAVRRPERSTPFAAHERWISGGAAALQCWLMRAKAPLPANWPQVRALVDLLPDIPAVKDDPFNSSPTDPKYMGPDVLQRFKRGEQLPVTQIRTPLVRGAAGGPLRGRAPCLGSSAARAPQYWDPGHTPRSGSSPALRARQQQDSAALLRSLLGSAVQQPLAACCARSGPPCTPGSRAS